MCPFTKVYSTCPFNVSPTKGDHPGNTYYHRTWLKSKTAKILGIDDRLGSLEKGKEATFFISEGDALDMTTDKIESIFIKGSPVSASNHQSELYEIYKDR